MSSNKVPLVVTEEADDVLLLVVEVAFDVATRMPSLTAPLVVLEVTEAVVFLLPGVVVADGCEVSTKMPLVLVATELSTITAEPIDVASTD